MSRHREIDMDTRLRSSLFVALLLFLYSTHSLAIPVNLSVFDVIDPTVTVFGPDNDSAQILEDPALAPVGLWETALAIPLGAASLSFSYELQVLLGNEDYFDFFFADLSAPNFSDGGFAGLYSGTVTQDLSGFAGGPLSLGFALNFGFGDFGFDSVLTIKNVRIVQSQPMPAPSTPLLLGLGLVMLLGMMRVRGNA